ncbi:MAG TPA: universal stress protein [Polyangiaceae bacterium]|jgi:nucleotide-binding universal stress UspA family protein
MPQNTAGYVIVVAIDYSESGDLALRRALELAAEKPAASVHVVNVLPLFPGIAPDPSTGGWIYAIPSVSEGAQQLTNYVQQKASSFAGQYGGANRAFLENIRVHQRLQAPAEEIAQLAADLEADLVIVGTHGHRGVSRFLLGSVAEATIRLSPCPVLVVRPKAIPVALPVPAILPPCPRCVEARKASGGSEFWCEQHRERHGQRHTYHQADRVGEETNMPLVFRS